MKYNTLARYAQGGLLILCLVLIGQARCAGERVGKAESELAIAKAETRKHQRAADSLLKAANSKDSLLKDSRQKLSKSEDLYRKRRLLYTAARDSAVNPGVERGTPEINPRLDLVIEAADKALSAADSVIGVQGRIIGLQAHQIGVLRGVISQQDSAIKRLNSSLALTRRSLKPSRIDKVSTAAKWVAVGLVGGAVLVR